MNILLIEDDQFKQELIDAELLELFPHSIRTVGRSVQQAVKFIRAAPYDLVVLDIALPSHASSVGSQSISQPSGGVEVLLELSFAERSDKVVIVTQYPEIEYNGRLVPLSNFKRATANTLHVSIAGVIYFDAQDELWRTQFRKAVS
jgi:CheY-like chemotaxis protein